MTIEPFMGYILLFFVVLLLIIVALYRLIEVMIFGSPAEQVKVLTRRLDEMELHIDKLVEESKTLRLLLERHPQTAVSHPEGITTPPGRKP